MDWDSISTYFQNQGVSKLVEHQIESFEDFIRNKLPLIVSSTAPIVVWNELDEVTKKYKYELRLSFENITYMKPRIQEASGRIKPMFPHEARMRNFTYAAQMFCDVRFVARSYKGEKLDTFEEQVKVFEGVSLGKIPVMLGSSLCIMNDYPLTKEEMGECPYDPFGYFLIHGSERTILCQEKVADNRIMVFYNKKTSAKYSYSVEMKSLHESFTTPPKKLEIRLSTKFNGLGYPMTICVPRFREDIPLMVMFRAFGVEADGDIARIIWGDSANPTHINMLAASFKECSDVKVYTREDAIEYLTHHLQYGTTLEDKKAYIRSLLETEYLPHVKFGGDTSDTKTLEARKMLLTSWMVRKLILTEQGYSPIDDRDAYPNKRVVTTGALLTHLFRQLFQKVCKDIRSKFVHEVNNDTWKKGDTVRPLDILNVNNLYKILKVSTIEGKLKQALATGNFTVQGLGTSGSASLSNATKVGVSQVLNRLSYSATISHLRRIQTPVEKSGKLLAPRKLHGSSWGYVCPVETPEGHSVGIVKAISMLAAITQHTPASVTMNVLNKLKGLSWVTDISKMYSGTMILVNGVIVAYTKNPLHVTTVLKHAKKNFQLHPHTSVSWNVPNETINIESDAGRFVRPVFRVENGKLLAPPEKSEDWNDWVKTCVEYIDPCETETVRIAMKPDEITNIHTHCEIHPTLILGHMASSIPFSDHNQSPRNTYQSAMGKQAMGVFARNYTKRLDKNGYILCSPMRPLVETRMMNVLKTQDMPSGDMIMVAIGIYGGYNQEDSVILNRASVDRGLFRTLYYTIYKDEEHRNVTSGKEERFMKPRRENTRGFKTSSYAAIADNGVPIIGAKINENDVVIGKVTSLKGENAGYQYRDSSTTHKNSETCRVDGVWQDKNSDGYPFVKVRVVSERVPEVGDKFCLTDDHEVMTLNRGWVSIKDVTTNDQVAQLNRQTNKLEYVYPLETFGFDHTGDMYEVNTQGISLKTTMNHRMWVQKRDSNTYELIEARDMMGKRMKFQSSAVLDREDATFDIGEYHFDGATMDAWLKVLGIWYAEGWVYVNTNHHTRRLEFAANKPRVQKELISACNTLQLKYNFVESTKKFYINDTSLVDYLLPFSVGAVNKYLPDWVFNTLSTRQSRILLEAMCLGDGHETGTSLQYFTSSVQLRDDVQRLCQHCGYTSEYVKRADVGHSAYMKDGRPITTTHIPWKIGIRRTRIYPTLNHGHVKSQLGQSESVTEFSGRVYCIRVPSEVFLVRRNGLCVFTGNSSRHGQKGTCGILLNEEDMPYTGSGIRPDLIMNPHAVPSRMTIAQLMETMYGKVCCEKGTLGDGTPYSHLKVTNIRDQLIELGMHPYGNEILYNGQTGEMMEAEIFMGPTFYQRLKHMVKDKAHSRARGPIVSLTRQPCEGRSRDGGLRVGEMERDCMISHGAAMFTKERLMDVSDPFTTGFCKSCGTLAVVNSDENIYHCGTCGVQTEFELKTIPYAVKLWAQELEAMHIVPRMVFE